MNNLENAIEKLLATLEKIRNSESLEKTSKGDTAPNEKGPDTEEIKQPTNDATKSAEMPHQEPGEKRNETETTTNTGTNLQGSVPAKVRESDISKRTISAGTFNKIVSSKSDYYILAVALAVLGIIIVKLYFMLFP